MTFIDYLWIFAASLVGIGFHFVKKAGQIQRSHLDKDATQVIKIYLKEDWYTMIGSALAIAFGLLLLRVGLRLLAKGQYISTITLLLQLVEIVFAALGYMGQMWIYKAFGTADKKVNQVLKTQE